MDVLAHLNRAFAGRYVVQREVGAGGMATVYLAQDMRHGRDVAIKVLKPELGAVLGADRFLAEIRTAASLQHPNVLPLFDSGEVDGLLFYVMPYVAEESLRARLLREKILPVGDAIHIAAMVAGALDHAHRAGVIHRDLKPENILLVGGEPILADFGIALAVSLAAGERLTGTGIALGTPQYMSPEQATGDRALDERTDVYSLGVVTYEMLTGEVPHSGATAHAVLARVLTVPPPRVSELRPSVPASLDEAVVRALAKIPADRWPSAWEFARALRGESFVGPTARPRPTRPLRIQLAMVAAMAAVAGGALGVWWGKTRSNPAVHPRVRFEISSEYGNPQDFRVAITPAGDAVILRAGDSLGYRLFRRPMTESVQSPLAGTQGAGAFAISPAGDWIAFVVDGQLRKTPMSGGPVVVLVASGLRDTGVAWVSDDMLVIGSRAEHAGLSWVSASGGPPRPLTVPDSARGELTHRSPRAARNGRTVLFATVGVDGNDSSRIGIAAVETGEAWTLPVRARFPVGFVDDHLVYVRADGTIMAVQIDLATPTVPAEPFVLESGNGFFRRPGSVDLGLDGSLATVTGVQTGALLLIRRGGEKTRLVTDRGAFYGPKFSADDRRIAMGIGTFPQTTIWVYHLPDAGLIRVTKPSGGWDLHPTWSPDDRRVVFSSSRQGRFALWSQLPEPGSEPELLAFTDTEINEATFSRDGSAMAYRKASGDQHDIEYRTPIRDSVPRLKLNSQFSEIHPSLSPDGQMLAYVSDETGFNEVYVRAVRAGAQTILVSRGGGAEPRWTGDSRTLFYRTADRNIAKAMITPPPRLSVHGRETVMEDLYVRGTNHHQYDVDSRGERFVFSEYGPTARSIVVDVNWLAGVRSRLRQSVTP